MGSGREEREAERAGVDDGGRPKVVRRTNPSGSGKKGGRLWPLKSKGGPPAETGGGGVPAHAPTVPAVFAPVPAPVPAPAPPANEQEVTVCMNV